MIQPARYVLRRLSQSPGFTIVAVLTLAIGIGANTAIFSVVEGVLLRPLGFDEPDRLVALRHSGPGVGILDFEQSTTTYTVYRESAESFEEVALYTDFTLNLTGEGQPARLATASVSASLFDVLRTTPAVGRPLIPADEAGEGAQVVLLSNALWRSRYGAASDIVGRTMRLNGRVWEIVGVMPPRFDFPYAETDIWIPFPIDPDSLGRTNFSYEAIARLNPGVTIAAADVELNRLLHEVPDRYPGEFTHRQIEDVQMSAFARPLREQIVGDIGNVLWILLGTVGFILLIACANVANLFLVRAEGRHREVALRTALGARFGDMARYFMAESVALSITGGLLGVGLAWAGVRALIGLSPIDIPRVDGIGLNPAVLGFTAAISLFAGLAFGMFPIVRYGRANLSLALKEGGRGGSAGRGTHRVRKLLAATQVALALVLLIGAGLMARSFVALKHVQPGFDPAGVLVFRVSLPAEQYPEAHDAANFYQRLLDELGTLPGVTHVGAVSNLPMTDGQSNNATIPEGMQMAADALPPIARVNYASPGYFETLDIPLLEGRTFERRDHENETGVMVVSTALARRFWPDESALGKRIAPGLFDGDEPDWFTIVGIVGDVRDDGPMKPPNEMVYYPLVGRPDGNGDWTVRSMTVAIKTSGEPTALSRVVTDKLRSLDAALPTAKMGAATRVVERAMAPTAFTMLLLLIAAVVAVLLGSVGIYGVVSYVVSQRTREIGVRMALGAGRARVGRMVVGGALLIAAVGVGVGLVAAFALTRLMNTVLYGVTATDPATFGAVVVVLLGVTALASYLPARRAASIHPTEALRHE